MTEAHCECQGLAAHQIEANGTLSTDPIVQVISGPLFKKNRNWNEISPDFDVGPSNLKAKRNGHYFTFCSTLKSEIAVFGIECMLESPPILRRRIT